MVQCVLKRSFFANHIAFELPEDTGTREAIKRELTNCREKNKDYVLITLQKPKRPRTTGEGSQNHHLNGHIMQICNETGNDYETIKYCVKMIAVEQMGYPHTEVSGHILPQPERECDTSECAKLIEAVHQLAAQMNIILEE